MGNFAIKLPFAVARPGLPQVASQDIKSLVDFETDTIEHWQFDNTANSLIGKKLGKLLVPQSNTHSFTARSVIIKNQAGQGLSTDILDMQVMTMAAVVKWQDIITPAKSQIIAGTLTPTIGQGGSGLYLSSTAPGVPILNVRGVTSTSLAGGLTAVPFGTYVFVASTEAVDSPAQTQTVLTGGVGSTTNGPYPAADKALATPQRNIALGNAYYVAATFQGGPDIEISEFMLWDKAKTAAELNTIYARAKARLASRGIAVL